MLPKQGDRHPVRAGYCSNWLGIKTWHPDHCQLGHGQHRFPHGCRIVAPAYGRKPNAANSLPSNQYRVLLIVIQSLAYLDLTPPQA